MKRLILLLSVFIFGLCGCSNKIVPISQDDVEYVHEGAKDDNATSYAEIIRSETDAEIIVYLVLGSGSINPVVKTLEKKKDEIVVKIDLESKQLMTDDMAYWKITIDSSLEYVGFVEKCSIETKTVLVK